MPVRPTADHAVGPQPPPPGLNRVTSARLRTTAERQTEADPTIQRGPLDEQSRYDCSEAIVVGVVGSR